MGFGQVPEPRYSLDVDAAVATYAHRIVASRGSIPKYGHVMVGGVEIDVDAAVARHRDSEIEADAFWKWVKAAELQA